VKSFAFQNPHVYLFVNVAERGSGEVTTYVVEMSYVQNMITHGITATTFKQGDRVTVKMNPLRDGRPSACGLLAKRGAPGTRYQYLRAGRVSIYNSASSRPECGFV
jgi:hypothetical protein